ncbi:MAG: hypothetical protein AAFR11_06650 [Pseudomonadota bacterium]
MPSNIIGVHSVTIIGSQAVLMARVDADFGLGTCRVRPYVIDLDTLSASFGSGYRDSPFDSCVGDGYATAYDGAVPLFFFAPGVVTVESNSSTYQRRIYLYDPETDTWYFGDIENASGNRLFVDQTCSLAQDGSSLLFTAFNQINQTFGFSRSRWILRLDLETLTFDTVYAEDGGDFGCGSQMLVEGDAAYFLPNSESIADPSPPLEIDLVALRASAPGAVGSVTSEMDAPIFPRQFFGADIVGQSIFVVGGSDGDFVPTDIVEERHLQ